MEKEAWWLGCGVWRRYYPWSVELFWQGNTHWYAHSVVSNSLWPNGLAPQAPLSMEFARQEWWSGMPFPPSRDLPNPGIEPTSPVSPALGGGFFTAEPLIDIQYAKNRRVLKCDHFQDSKAVELGYTCGGATRCRGSYWSFLVSDFFLCEMGVLTCQSMTLLLSQESKSVTAVQVGAALEHPAEGRRRAWL